MSCEFVAGPIYRVGSTIRKTAAPSRANQSYRLGDLDEAVSIAISGVHPYGAKLELH